jgi:hypothetical protein
MAGNNPGDGRTNPFGDGAGKGTGGNVAGNDFTKNPRGSNTGTGRPRDFQGTGERQKMATPEGQDVNPADRAPGPSTAAEAADAGSASGYDVGVGTVGNAAKPFRLGGG